MSTLTIPDIPPDYNATIQLYARVGGVAFGAPIPGVLGVFDLGTVPPGDYDVQLSGDWAMDGQKFPLRITSMAVYYADFWWQIDSAVPLGIVITPPVTANVCRVQLRARRGSTGTLARALITCGASGRLADSAFSNIAFDGLTDSNGLLLVDLPWSSITGVGKYRFKLIDIESGDVFHDRTVTVPDQPTAIYEELP